MATIEKTYEVAGVRPVNSKTPELTGLTLTLTPLGITVAVYESIG